MEPTAATQPASEERASDRRESDRVPLSLYVRDAALGGSYEEHDGNIALGGFYFTDTHPPGGERFDVRVVLPGTDEEFTATGEVLRVSRDGPRYGTHLRFSDIGLEAELSLARWLQRG